MGSLTEQDIAALDISREEKLKLHCATNFEPKHPGWVIDSIMEGFSMYWSGTIDLSELSNKCYLKNIEGLHRYFTTFINKEDLN